jgi:uncharacterized protein (TIGR02145 family)
MRKNIVETAHYPSLRREYAKHEQEFNHKRSIMNKTKSLLLTASLVLVLTLTQSCSSGDEGGGGTQGGGSSSSGGEAQTYNFCLFNEKCLEGPYPANDCEESGGVPSNNCPYNGDGGDGSSSSLAQSSSSSVQSSSSLAPSSSSSVRTGKGNDINNYETIEIGTQTWMAENLDYVVEGSKCYSNDPAKCDEYGSLYTWATAMALPASCNYSNSTCSGEIQSPHQGICPDGWHIPSSEDWGKLSRYVDGTSGTFAGCESSTAGRYLKATSGWRDNGNGTDLVGFSALPGGYYSNLGGGFSSGGQVGEWWSASESDRGWVYICLMSYYGEFARWNDNSQSDLLSVRCIKDN